MTPWHARLAALAAAVGLLFAALLAVVRPWYTSWGATAAEQAASLPGDGIVAGAARETRAISIAAPAERVFGWVAQLGQNRAGFYSYDLLENLVGCEMPRVERLDPTLQRWSVGERLWMYPPEKLDGVGYATLLEFEPGRALAFGTHAPGEAVASAPTGSWSMVVEPRGPHASRLIVRGAGSAPPGLLGVAFNRTVFEPLHFAMERRMMEGIRALAEGQPLSRLHDGLMVLSWALTAAGFVANAVLVLLGRAWQRRLVTFLAAGVVFQILTLGQPQLAIGLVLVGALLLASAWPDTGALRQSLRLLPAVESALPG